MAITVDTWTKCAAQARMQESKLLTLKDNFEKALDSGDHRKVQITFRHVKHQKDQTTESLAPIVSYIEEMQEKLGQNFIQTENLNSLTDTSSVEDILQLAKSLMAIEKNGISKTNNITPFRRVK